MKIDGGLMTTDLRDAARLAAPAEALGSAGLGTAEAGHAPYLPAALAATATERITIGTNIAVAFPRSPLVHAQVAWDLQAASRGRFVLGLGTQVKGHNERRYSTPWLAPGPRLREMIQLIRHIWDVWQHGARPGFEGKYYRFSLMTPFFSPAPLDCPLPQIYIAGDRKSTRLNSSHSQISYAVFCLKKKNKNKAPTTIHQLHYLNIRRTNIFEVIQQLQPQPIFNTYRVIFLTTSDALLDGQQSASL